MAELSELIQTETSSLLETIGITGDVQVSEDEDGFKVVIDSPDNALLIGKHGNTLSSLEHVLTLIVAKKTGEYKRIIIEVGGYREDRENYLRDLVGRLQEEVIATGIEKRVSGLKPWERRFIHLLLAENDQVTTESIGEGRDRVLLIKKQ